MLGWKNNDFLHELVFWSPSLRRLIPEGLCRVKKKTDGRFVFLNYHRFCRSVLVEVEV